MSSSGTTDAGRRGRDDPTMTPDPRPLPTALTMRPRGRCGIRVPAAVFACTAELLFRTELMVLPTDEEKRLQHEHLNYCNTVSTLRNYGELHHGFRCPGGLYKWYKDCLKTTLNQCNITPSGNTCERQNWLVIHVQVSSRRVQKYDVIQEFESKRDLSKSRPPSTRNFECQICRRMCCSRTELLAHNKSHLWCWDPTHQRLSSWMQLLLV